MTLEPWAYELLTSTFDFPIYKTEEQLKTDKEELLENFLPYFSKDEIIQKRQVNKMVFRLENDSSGGRTKIHRIYQSKAK